LKQLFGARRRALERDLETIALIEMSGETLRRIGPDYPPTFAHDPRAGCPPSGIAAKAGLLALDA
jgi:hypothetical protein